MSAAAENNSCDKLGVAYSDYVITWMGCLGIAATIVCSAAALLVFINKLHKYFVHRLALYQVVAGFFYGIALALELLFFHFKKETYYDGGRQLCEAIGYFILYFSWVKLLFTSWVVVHLFCFTVFYKNLENLEVFFVIISIVAPHLIAWIPFVGTPGPVYGPTGAWCWIENWVDNCPGQRSNRGVAEQFSLWYGPAMIISIVQSFAIVIIVFRLLLCYQPEQDEEMSLLSRERSKRRKAFKELLPLIAYPILFCVLLIPPLINRVLGASSTNKDPHHYRDVILASGAFVPLQPFFAGLALFIHVVVLTFPKSVCKCKCFNRRHRQMHSMEYPTIQENQNTWRYTADDKPPTTYFPTEAIIPNESEVLDSIPGKTK